MKKAISIILALLLVLSLTACAGDKTTKESPTPSASTAPAESPAPAESAEPASSPSEKSLPKEIGFYDPDYDYTQNERYKIVYMILSMSDLLRQCSDAFTHWAANMNCDYTLYDAQASQDTFINSIETFASQGYQGFIYDPDIEMFPRIIEISEELGVSWMSAMNPPFDADGKIGGPCLNCDSTDWGRRMANWVIDYAEKTWPDADKSEIGMLSITFSANVILNARTIGAQEVWDSRYPELKDNFFIGDGLVEANPISAEAGFNQAGAIMAINPQIKYWLVTGCFDDYAQGAATAAEQAGKQDNTVCISCGGTNLINNYDAGIETSWKAALYVPQMLLTEPVFCGVYAMLSGQATPETLWPEWINKAGGEKYATVEMPAQIIDKDNYQEYMEYVDLYTNTDLSNYEYHGTEFKVRFDPPASFAG